MANKFTFYNYAETTITDTPLLIGATTLNVDSNLGMTTPASGFTLRGTLVNPADYSDWEVVDITAISGTAFTIARASENAASHPAKEWPNGTLLRMQITAKMLDQFYQVDTGGNTRGSDSVNIQPSRDADTQVASGAEAVNIGHSAEASGTKTVAIGPDADGLGIYGVSIGGGSRAGDANTLSLGYQSIIYRRSDYSVNWESSSSLFFNNLYVLPSNTSYGAYALNSGTSGASEPSTSLGVKDDGTLEIAVTHIGSNNDYSTSIGADGRVQGQHVTRLGRGGFVFGSSSTVLGASNNVAGNSSTVAGYNNDIYAPYNVVVGTWNSVYSASNVLLAANTPTMYGDRRLHGNTVMIASDKYRPFEYCRHIRGFEFVGQHDWDYFATAQDADETARHTLQEVTFYSNIPMQLGDAGWPGAGATVKHGQSIRVGSYIYTAYVLEGDYFDTTTTGGSEPTWPTTVGNDVLDGNVWWICVGTSFEWTMPDYARFVPVSVGALVKWCTPGGAPTYPQITAGINGDLDKWLAATTLSKLTGDYAQHMVEPTNTEGAKQFGIDITTAGTDLDCTAVLAVKGYVIESDVA